MPTVTLNLYDAFRLKQASGNGAVKLSGTSPIATKVMLVASGYTPVQNTHNFRDDVTNEVVGNEYVAGGATCANPTDTVDGAGLVTVDFDDPPTWNQHATGFNTARRAVFYAARGGASSADELIAYTDDFGADKGNVDGDFSIALNASGLYTSAR